MPRDVDLATVDDRIEACLDSTNDEVNDRETDDDGITVHWNAKRGDFIYTIEYQNDDVDFLTVNFSYDILGTVANALEDEDAIRVLESRGIDSSDMEDQEHLKRQAAAILLENAPDNIKISFGNQLVQIMAHPAQSFNFQVTENGGYAGFMLTKNIYPFSDEFTFREFDEAVQTIITLGHAAATYTQLSLDVQNAIEDHLPEDIPRYLQ